MVKLTAASGLVREHGGPASDPEDDMGKLIAFEWMSLNGVFDADTMNEWWVPYNNSDGSIASRTCTSTPMRSLWDA